MKIHLKKLCPSDGEDIYIMLQEFPKMKTDSSTLHSHQLIHISPGWLKMLHPVVKQVSLTDGRFRRLFTGYLQMVSPLGMVKYAIF